MRDVRIFVFGLPNEYRVANKAKLILLVKEAISSLPNESQYRYMLELHLKGLKILNKIIN